jgi:23S rRNA (uracil1939-C5)-methyltransferase
MEIEDFNPRRIKPVKREAVLRIEKYAGEGASIAYENEKVIFVRYAIPGELIKANIYKETKDYAMAEPLEVLEPSPERQKPFCPYFGVCGGCDYQMISYEKQLEIKKAMVLEAFRRIGKIELSDLTGIIKSPKPFYYRNTETYKVSPKQKKIGFFRKDTKFIVDIEECKLAQQEINQALKDVKCQAIFPEHNFKVRATDEGDTVVHWIPTEKYDDRSVYEKVSALGKTIEFKISKDSFFQVNNSVIPLWLSKIVSFLDQDGHERIFDLYSGIGLITLFVSFFARETIGVEIARSSVKDAIHNMEKNSIKSNVSFIEASVEEKLPELGYADVMIIDPPRKGVDPACVETLLKMLPQKIIYSSCKPSTMARDIHALSEKYELKELVLVDMFPQTHHVEMLGLLLRK